MTKRNGFISTSNTKKKKRGKKINHEVCYKVIFYLKFSNKEFNVASLNRIFHNFAKHRKNPLE